MELPQSSPAEIIAKRLIKADPAVRWTIAKFKRASAAALLTASTAFVCIVMAGERQGVMATLNGNDQQYTSGDWWARNNVWGRGSLVNGSDFTQSVTLDTSTFPNGTVLQWNWPPGPQGVRSYPEVGYGQTWFLPSPAAGPHDQSSVGGIGVPATQADNFAALSVTYDFSMTGPTSHYDVMMELFTTATPNQKGSYLHEISYFPHFANSGGTPLFQYTDPTLGLMQVSRSQDPKQIGIQPVTMTNGVETPRDVTSGTFDMKTMYDQLISHGVISGSEYVNGAEFGAEVFADTAGSGTVTINKLSYNWQPNGSSGSGSDPSTTGDTLMGGQGNNNINGGSGKDYFAAW